MKDDIEARVRKIITGCLGVKDTKVLPEALLEDDLGADSLDLVELVMAAEEEFNCEITDEEAEKAKTVQDTVVLVRSKTASAA